MNQPLGRDTLDAARAVLASASSTRRDFMAIVVFVIGTAKARKMLICATLQLLCQTHEGIDSIPVSYLTENSTMSALHPRHASQGLLLSMPPLY